MVSRPRNGDGRKAKTARRPWRCAAPLMGSVNDLDFRDLGELAAAEAAAVDRVRDRLHLAGVGEGRDRVGLVGLPEQLQPKVQVLPAEVLQVAVDQPDRKSTRLNSSH